MPKVNGVEGTNFNGVTPGLNFGGIWEYEEGPNYHALHLVELTITQHNGTCKEVLTEEVKDCVVDLTKPKCRISMLFRVRVIGLVGAGNITLGGVASDPPGGEFTIEGISPGFNYYFTFGDVAPCGSGPRTWTMAFDPADPNYKALAGVPASWRPQAPTSPPIVVTSECTACAF